MDAVIGGLSYAYPNNNLYTASTPYYRDDITWCTRPAQRKPVWLNFFFVFDGIPTMALLLLTFYVYLAGFYIYSGCDGTNLDFQAISLNAFAFLLSMGSNYKPLGPIAKFFSVVGSLVCFVVCQYYLCVYTTIILFPIFERQTSTTLDLIDNVYELSGEAATFKDLNLREKVKYSVEIL